ncbi:MAG: hypothetical protein Q9159_002406 [Coniocarpon cinnabarinum]
MAQPTPEETTRLLTRIAQKPGVSSTLILSRSTGAVVRTSGLISAPEDDTANGNTSQDGPSTSSVTQTTRNSTLSTANGENAGSRNGTRDANEVAKLVWNFFKHAGDTVDGMFGSGPEGEGGDEVKLVRLRTRKSEVVVVPGEKTLTCSSA